MTSKYRLEERVPVAEPDLVKWAQWFETAERRVASTTVGGALVSTVFLGLDHNFSGGGPPLLFETMIFQDGLARDDWMGRYPTWAEAEAGHARAVQFVRDEVLD